MLETLEITGVSVMAYSELNRLLSQRPFQPVELTTSDGRTFAITHPEQFVLSKTLLVVQLPDVSLEFLSLLHLLSAKTFSPEAV